MISLSINLPPAHRLDLHLVRPRRREDDGDSILPSIKKIRSARRGHKMSRFFRHIFEHKRSKKVLAAYMPVLIVAGSLMPTATFADSKPQEEVVVSVDQTQTKTEISVRYPVENVIVNQGYSYFHPGVDFEGITGDPVRPFKKGRVTHIQYSRFAYGNAITLEHEGGLSSLYAHLSKIEVSEGQDVATDTIIGRVGATGRSFGDHLHFEIHKNGTAINPLSALPRLTN